MNRYQRISDQPLENAAIEYWQNTAAYWRIVRQQWQAIMAGKQSLQIEKKINQQFLFEKHFSQAQKFSSAKDPSLKEIELIVRKTLQQHVTQVSAETSVEKHHY